MDTCPHLGLLEDPSTSAIFPSEQNCCHLVKPVKYVLETHQTSYCLGDNYINCPVFVDKNSTTGSDFLVTPLPLSRRNSIFRYVLITFLLIGAVVFSWYIRENIMPHDNEPINSSKVIPATSTGNASEELASDNPSETPTITVEPTVPYEGESHPLPTLAVTLPPGIETPISVDPILVVHQVVQGEDLATIAERYKTTVESIQSINFNLPLPLWENWMIVVPYDKTNVSNLPVFEVYWVSPPGLTIDTIAEIFDLDVSLLLRFNYLESGNELVTNRWVLIPHNTP